jgi:hypothetical protein
MTLKPEKVGLWVVLFFLCFFVAFAYFENWNQRRAFDAMNPAAHLAASRVALGQERFDDAERQANAIASGAPEALEASRVKEEIAAARQRVKEEAVAVRQSEQLAYERRLAEKKLRTAAPGDLQDSLKNLGYDLTVAQSDKPDEIVITSKDFDDTDHRVRFLSFLRGRNSPAVGACLAGFQTVRLKSSGFFGFSEAYSLDCFAWR